MGREVGGQTEREREREGGERVTYGGVLEVGVGGATTWCQGKHPLAPGSAGACCSVAAARKLWSPTPIVGELAANDRGEKHCLASRNKRPPCVYVLIFAVGNFGPRANGRGKKSW